MKSHTTVPLLAYVSPELRDQARAAAKRDGVLISEWVTRALVRVLAQDALELSVKRAVEIRPLGEKIADWAHTDIVTATLGFAAPGDLCHRCGHCKASDALYDHPGGCECAACLEACWGGQMCRAVGR